LDAEVGGARFADRWKEEQGVHKAGGRIAAKIDWPKVPG